MVWDLGLYGKESNKIFGLFNSSVRHDSKDGVMVQREHVPVTDLTNNHKDREGGERLEKFDFVEAWCLALAL